MTGANVATYASSDDANLSVTTTNQTTTSGIHNLINDCISCVKGTHITSALFAVCAGVPGPGERGVLLDSPLSLVLYPAVASSKRFMIIIAAEGIVTAGVGGGAGGAGVLTAAASAAARGRGWGIIVSASAILIDNATVSPSERPFVKIVPHARHSPSVPPFGLTDLASTALRGFGTRVLYPSAVLRNTSPRPLPSVIRRVVGSTTFGRGDVAEWGTTWPAWDCGVVTRGPGRGRRPSASSRRRGPPLALEHAPGWEFVAVGVRAASRRVDVSGHEVPSRSEIQCSSLTSITVATHGRGVITSPRPEGLAMGRGHNASEALAVVRSRS